MKSADRALETRGAARARRDLAAFLPAALEIVETPPPPLAGAIGGTIIALFCVALVWAYFGKIDIVASATGKIVASGRSKVIQPFETSVVRAIHVSDGQLVKAGEPLVELDPTLNNAEASRLRSDLLSAQLDMARLKAALVGEGDPMAAFVPPAGATPAQIAAQRQFLQDQVAEHNAKLAALDSQKVQKEAELATIGATVDKLNAVLPVLQERVNVRQILYEHATGSKVNYLEIYQNLVETQHDLQVQKNRQQEARAAVAATIDARAQAAAEYRRGLAADFVEAQRKAGELANDLVKAEERSRLQLLTSPVDGAVQQLAIHTVGGVVTPGQSLLVVAPSESHLEVEAMISNRDIGFVHPGQDVEIKVDTFNFTRYGLIHGHVTSVSQDSIARDLPPDKAGNGAAGAAAATSEPKGQELVYAAKITLDKTEMQVDDRRVELSPGMAVTAEIKTGSQAVLSYLLSPLLRYKQESLRER
jgi:hemolysin D